MKYFIIAGEASGDLHGSSLIRALQEEDSQAEIIAWGGDRMEAEGALLLKHYRELAFMGFWEVMLNLRTIIANFRQCKKEIIAAGPDVLILIDYPGFNLRMAKWAKKKGIRVFYYISPQLWAWHSSRVHQIKKNVERMYVILPFEKAFYEKYDYNVDFVGHPLLDVVAAHPYNDTFKTRNQLDERQLVALLPGSRKQEILRMLPLMLALPKHFPQLQFAIAAAPSQPLSFYREVIASASGDDIVIIADQTYDLLQHAAAAIVTSGTATLEAALFRVPQMVVYSGNPMSYSLARRLIQVAYISLVNLILDKPLLKELIQSEYKLEQVKSELQRLFDPGHRDTLLAAYEELSHKLGESGAAERAARLMVRVLQNQPGIDS